MDEMKCGICMELMYQAVTVMPCLHSFCGACYSEWMALSVQCPACRNNVEQVKKNSLLNSMIDKYLAKYPDQKRPQEEYDDMDKNNVINADLIPVSKLKTVRKRKADPRPVPQVIVPAVPQVMSAAEWEAITSRSQVPVPSVPSIPQAFQAVAEEEKKGVRNEECQKCKKRCINSTNPATICKLCGLKVCRRCKRSTEMFEIQSHGPEKDKYQENQ